MSSAPVTLTGRYYDGRQPIAQAATLLLGGREAVLIGEQLMQRNPVTQLYVSPRIGRADRFVSFPGGGQFQCGHDPSLDRLPQESRGEGMVAWLERHVAVAVASIAVIVAAVAGAYYYALPWLAEQAAVSIGVESERRFGDQALVFLDKQEWFAPTQLAAEQQTAVRAEFDHLRAGLQAAPQLRLEFRAGEWIGANAFALPGGLIVITDEMVQAAESVEEVGAVLAHEIGHVERRHSLRHVIQGSAIGLIMATLTADAASLSIAVAGAPAALAQAKYSRDFETEADDYAFALLKTRGRSPGAFADLMDRLSRGDDKAERRLSFLSSHPVTRERVQRARSAAAQ